VKQIDRIKAMDIDEMAEWLGMMVYCNCNEDTVDEYRSWLESEVRE
jgi:hypothetical protein